MPEDPFAPETPPSPSSKPSPRRPWRTPVLTPERPGSVTGTKTRTAPELGSPPYSPITSGPAS
jgi:hypothetical protein